MTVDYTKISSTDLKPKKQAKKIAAKPVTGNSSAPHEMVCRECYHIGTPIIMQRGSWVTSLAYLLLITPLIFVIKLLFSSDRSDRYPGERLRLLPALPHTRYKCRKCGHPDSMVEKDSKEGEHAVYWALKDKTGPGNF